MTSTAWTGAAPPGGSRAFNVASGTPHTIAELAAGSAAAVAPAVAFADRLAEFGTANF